jgi:GNAT superfamily N-acetyltransferase
MRRTVRATVQGGIGPSTWTAAWPARGARTRDNGRIPAPRSPPVPLPAESIVLRPARRDDLPLILALIGELAEYERLPHETVATLDDMDAALFGPRPAAEVVVAECDGEAAGFALFFVSFSTFLGKPGLYLEDLFVRPAFRGRGVGKRLMVHLARLALQRGYGRFEWSVLDWNTPAIDFYRRLGAKPLDEWTVQRVSGEALRALAATVA